MSNSKVLYAWAVPVGYSRFSPVDHTWVTTYDSRSIQYPDIASVITAGELYWYCWGDFHVKGGTPINPTGFLGSQLGGVNFASCLVKPNEDCSVSSAARGAVYDYGVNGVCHQLANQVLFATSIGGQLPLTVKNARGYFASTFVYGVYGTQSTAFLNKIATCQPSHPAVGAKGRAMTKALGFVDDFEERARSVLGAEDAELLNKLLSLKGEVQNFVSTPFPGFAPPDADALNARNQHLLDQAAILLGPDKFKRIFGFAPEEKIDLVDEEIMRKFKNQ